MVIKKINTNIHIIKKKKGNMYYKKKREIVLQKKRNWCYKKKQRLELNFILIIYSYFQETWKTN